MTIRFQQFNLDLSIDSVIGVPLINFNMGKAWGGIQAQPLTVFRSELRLGE